MSADALLTELNGVGISLSLDGDLLRVEARAGALSPDLRERLATAKPELVARLLSDLRMRLLTIAKRAALSPALVESLPTPDVAACDGLSDEILMAYLHALKRSNAMHAGIVPAEYTQVVNCDGCGPVWLWAGCPARVMGCPWCFPRKKGRTLPRPGDQL